MLLTLAIPTYNRAASLRATLATFVSQVENSGSQSIEIVISDNCSTDDTPSVCAGVIAAHSGVCIRYFRNDTNVGFDRNVDALFDRARGKYVWTFSDDDCPSADALETVLAELKTQDVRFAFVNYQVSIDGQLLPSRFGAGANQVLAAPALLKTIRFSNSLISSCIFLRQAWFDVDAKKYVGTFWIHFFIAREILQSGSSLIFGQPLFTMMQSGLEKSRAERRRDDPAQVEFYMLAHLKFVEFASELHLYAFDRETVELARIEGEREDIHQVVNFKLTAPAYSMPQLLATWRHLGRFRMRSLQFWLVITPLLLLPGWVFRLARIAYRAAKQWLR
jgi:glycosyltransferase involved in cell wall biosynthesis